MSPYALMLLGGFVAIATFGARETWFLFFPGAAVFLMGLLWHLAKQTSADTARQESLDEFSRRLREREERRARGELEGTKAATLFLFDPRLSRWPGRLIDIPFRKYGHPEWGHPDPDALLPFVREVFPSVRAVRTEEKGQPELRIVDADTGDELGEIRSPVLQADRLEMLAEQEGPPLGGGP